MNEPTDELGRRTDGHDAENMRRIVNRLRRAEGQLHALIGAMGPDANCRDVVIQLAAVSKALDRAGFAIVASALQDCLAENPAGTGTHDGMDKAEIEKLFMSLA
jgi:DNA-binding FrmR family transcriptional regulator